MSEMETLSKIFLKNPPRLERSRQEQARQHTKGALWWLYLQKPELRGVEKRDAS